MNLPDGYFLQHKKYRLTRTIGQGGFGITYLGVWNTIVKGELGAMRTDVPVCVKEYFFKDYCYRDNSTYAVKVHSETGEKLFNKFKEKLIKEAKILSDVHHPHIVNVLEVFEENNTAYIVMEYIDGCSLKHMLENKGVMTENKAFRYIHQAGNALDFVHEKNICHLDIKPGNILIDRHNNARLIDFGVSKRYDIENKETTTTTLTLSKGFASIEQYDDEGTLNFSPCPDVYSLGATMYNILTGVVPVESILRATKDLTPLSSLNKNISPKTEAVILKAMSVRAEDRYQSVKEMLASLDIPPYEFEEPEPTLPDTAASTGSLQDRDDDTVYTNASDDFDKEDGTVVIGGEVETAKVASKGSSATLVTVLVISGLLLVAFAGYAFYYYYIGKEKTYVPLNDVPVRSFSPLKWHEVIEPDTLTVTPVTPVTPEKPTVVPERIITKPQVTPTERIPTVDNNPDTSSDSIYNQLFISAKEKMNAGKYSDAMKDLEKASELKNNVELHNLMKECTDKIEEKNIADRLDKYELRSNSLRLGKYYIVRDKTTKLYGVIDEKGIVHIPCKYKQVERISGGRAFLRSDGKYDTYNDSGELLETAVDFENLIQ
ncbi:MAG: protein kinase [Tannerella sp.]|jgi:serine/threonine-protein kinase|nr:protein kinase [Tannerella sp.]